LPGHSFVTSPETLPPAVFTQQLIIEDMCKICGRFPNTPEKGLEKGNKKCETSVETAKF